MTTTVKELKVSAIENGTVIDHIPPKSVFQVVKILNLTNFDNHIFVGTNLDSKKYRKKGIIKISNHYFEKDDINKIALIAPHATLIIIKDYKVVEKMTVELPDKIEGTVKCVNPNCVTNFEDIMAKFSVIDKENVKLRCHYCEKITEEKNMEFNNHK